MQARIDAERADLEAAFGDQVGYSSVFSAAGSVRVYEKVERYFTGLPSVIPGQPFEGDRVKAETGKYTLPEVKVDPSELHPCPILSIHVQYTRTESDRLGYATVRLTGSPIARDLEKYTEVFTEGVKC